MLEARSDQSWSVGGAIEAGDRFGRVLLAADVAGDAQADLIVGATYEDLGDAWDAGVVAVVFGGAGMLSGGAVEHGDQFGLVAG